MCLPPWVHATAERVGLTTLRFALPMGTIPPMRRRVLIVDDNGAFRAAARQLLERSGFIVVAEAETGNKGVVEAKLHNPDLALVDVQLPDCDGFEVTEQLSGLMSPPQVILISSLDGSDFGALVGGSSALGFIPKAELSARAIEALLFPRD
jgi:CheY-like chemotaxis protein